MDSVLTAAILPLLTTADKKKMKDAIVAQIVSNPSKFIDLSMSLDFDMKDVLNSDDVKYAISEAVVAAVLESNELGKEVVEHITDYVKSGIEEMADDGYLVDRDKIGDVVTGSIIKSFKAALKK